jgi:hypothetical protein
MQARRKYIELARAVIAATRIAYRGTRSHEIEPWIPKAILLPEHILTLDEHGTIPAPHLDTEVGFTVSLNRLNRSDIGK